MNRGRAYDFGTICGCAVFCYGAWLSWAPLGWLCAGAILAVVCELNRSTKGG